MAGRVSGFFGELSLAKLSEYSKPIAFGLRFLRTVFYIFDEFAKDNCLQTAASLAYTTLLSLVPLFAISLAVLSRFKFSQETIQSFLMKNFLPEAAFQAVIMENIRRFASQTATLSIFGGLFLAVTAVALLNTVEGSFNAIWRVSEKRTLLGRFTAFWSVITFSPLLLGASFVLTSRFYRVRYVGELLRRQWIQDAIHLVLPFLLIFLIFFLADMVLPHTKVKAFPALVGAVIATALFSFAKWAFGVYVTNYAHFDRIYGILGTLPAFLVWIYISWVIVLFGSEVAYTFQYHRLEIEEKQWSLGEPIYRPYYGIRVVLALDQHFRQGRGALSADELARGLGLTYEKLEEILRRLMESRIVARVDDTEQKFLLAKDPHHLPVEEIVEAMEGRRLVTPSWPVDSWKDIIERVFGRARDAAEDVLGRITIGELGEKVGREESRLDKGLLSAVDGGTSAGEEDDRPQGA